MVFNHTAEGNENGPTLSFRGIDNQTYYMLTPDGYYYNFSGCGNTLNCNNPVVRGLVLDCLRYWAAEYHIDGFRFDLASILGRDPWGAPMSNPPLLESLAFDPVLGKCKLIAEAWDAGGLYQVGSFPAFGRWAEWNGKYRDDIRRFLKGDAGLVGAVAQRLRGSPDLYGWNRRGPTASVNFITCHDGFTLHDLFSYDHKHNEGNGENNRDGANDNHSWNCGAEGETTDERHQCPAPPPHQVRLDRAAGQPRRADGADGRRSRAQPERQQQYLLPGQRAELVGLDPGGARVRAVAFRPHDDRPAQGASGAPSGAAPDRTASAWRHVYADITWHGTRAWHADWSPGSRTIAFMLAPPASEGGAVDDFIYVALNSHWETLPFELPALAPNQAWHVAADSGATGSRRHPPRRRRTMPARPGADPRRRSLRNRVGRPLMEKFGAAVSKADVSAAAVSQNGMRRRVSRHPGLGMPFVRRSASPWPQ